MAEFTADRLIEELNGVLREYGEVSAVLVYEQAGSGWVEPPLERIVRPGAWRFASGDESGYVWPNGTHCNPTVVRGRLVGLYRHLGSLAWSKKEQLPESLRKYLRCEPDDPARLWLWFAAGFAVTKLACDQPRTIRVCWGSDGLRYNADCLESSRQYFPDAKETMPPNADCWLIQINDLLLTSIEAVVYLAGFEGEEPATSASPATIKASDLDRDRVAFMEKLKGTNRRITQKEVAAKWNAIHKDDCDEQGIRNAVYRVKNHGKAKQQHNKT